MPFVNDKPEFVHYKDEGCKLSSSCLNCPLPECTYVESNGKRIFAKQRMRNRKIVQLFATQGKQVKELALMFGVGRRTVERVLETARKEKLR